ncbi:MAG: hypothetical protein F6K40_38665 [Okeania sp. SIO3I5]|uniref:hypothetical protein n=1 Tax=Okeania sp. SIO3I5 TaxID=2607805 RepID=UPI0013B96E5E|nr:hypothetical protein [Okeania sp. SIO3I5]NEQ41789.1 hypothetical protein [Okeania sp. SIO3I5]
MTQAVSSLNFAQKKTFLTEVFFNIGITFFIYLCIVCSVAQFKITRPLSELLYGSQTNTIIALVIYSVLCYLVYTLFGSKTGDLTKYIGYIGIIFLKALWVSPILILLADQYPNIIIESFGMSLMVIGYINRLANHAVKANKGYNFLAPIVQVGIISVTVAAILGIIFGFDLGLFYNLIVVFLYSLGLLIVGVQILNADKNSHFSFEKGEQLRSSLFVFSVLEIIYLYIAFLLIMMMMFKDNS